METEWVDFRAVKTAVTMQMVLDHYGITLKRSGNELRGKCPIHRGSDNKHFTANMQKNVFKCFFPRCGAHGNVLDFVAATEHCSVREAARKLNDWFQVGDRDAESKSGAVSEFKIAGGIYSDNQGRVYEVIGIARQPESSERFVVYRELFDKYQLVVISTKTFPIKFGPSSPHPLSLVRSL